MIVKAIEIRDSMTFIPALAIKMAPATEGQRYLLRRAGYSLARPSIMLMRMRSGRAEYNPYGWPDNPRTMRAAHLWIKKHFDELEDGAVVDVEFILGETKKPKRSEQFEEQENT